jgi:hypothetical protein
MGIMSTAPAITIPPSPEIASRIRVLRDELRALRRLLQLSRAAEQAETARRHRQAQTSDGGSHHAA